MKREIGSIFEIDRKQLKSDSRPAGWEIDSFHKKGYQECCMVSSGRDALTLALRQIGQDRGGKRLRCLLPMYTCDTVIAPFEQSGVQIMYYSVDRRMRPDVALFERQLEMDRPDVVVVHAHYGVDTLAAVRPLLQRFQQRGGLVIEDLTQCIFMPLDYTADYYVLSLRKWLGIPDGGMAVSKRRFTGAVAQERVDFTEQKMQAMTAKYDYLMRAERSEPGAAADKQAFLSKHRAAEGLLDRDTGVYRMSEKAMRLLRQADMVQVKQRRAANAAYLSRILKNCPGIVCPLTYTGAEAPLYFPVYVENREKVQQYLSAQDIYAPVLWPVPAQIGSLEKQTDYIYRQMLAIPCDQRYGREEMDWVALHLRRAAAL